MCRLYTICELAIQADTVQEPFRSNTRPSCKCTCTGRFPTSDYIESNGVASNKVDTAS